MLLDRAMRTPRNSIESNPMTWEEAQQWFHDNFFNGEALDVRTHTAEALSPVSAAHRILTNSFGMIPFSVYKKDGDARVSVQDDALSHVLKGRPNPNMSPFLCGKILMSNAFWRGFGACWNVRDSSGELIERIPLPTECCTIRKDSNTGTYWYDYNVDGVQRTFSSYELSFLFFESYDGIHGRGMLQLAREVIAADGMAQRYNKKFYQNGARISGIVEVETDANKETRDKIKEEFKGFASADAFKVAVLDHTMKYNPIGLNQSDAQYIESRGFSVEEVSRFTGIPKYMLQTGKESYDSNSQQRVDYVTDTLVPFVTAWEQENTYKLLSPDQRKKGWYLRGNVSVLLRGDDAARSKFYQTMVFSALYCPDECRAMEERNPIPGGLGKKFLATKNLASLESVLKGDGNNA